ncbi:MAG: COX15/CtaA family protein [Balneolia bacterium]|nr:COX15/CtaA family protein [Balneolia bacterium]
MTASTERQLRIWYLSGAFLVFLILIVGGITRLTQSGLSITEWNPVMGVIPPLSESDWMSEFDKYRASPEYQQINKGMSLEDFKFIYFWEYIHRVFARLIGIVFIVPFIWFWAKGKLDRVNKNRAFVLFGLGFLQGFMGWFMVMSGLNDVPYVSPYRLGMHLMLAFVIFGACVWFALDVRNRNLRPLFDGSSLNKWLAGFSVVLWLQIFWGALVAGHKAGYIYNTFPKMYDNWIPPEAWRMDPFIINFFDNIAMVQFMHRLLGTLLLVAAGMMLWKTWFSKVSLSRSIRKWMNVTVLLLAVQYLTGVFTLLWRVPVWLGVWHQAWAMLLFGALIVLWYARRYDR